MLKGKTTGASLQIFTISGVCLQRLAAAYKRNKSVEEQTLKGIWTIASPATDLRFATLEVGLSFCAMNLDHNITLIVVQLKRFAVVEYVHLDLNPQLT